MFFLTLKDSVLENDAITVQEKMDKLEKLKQKKISQAQHYKNLDLDNGNYGKN